MPTLTLRTQAEIRAVLTDPGFAVPPVPAATPTGDVRWLRASVARFSSRSEHRRRRELVTDHLAAVPVGALRRRARARTADVLRESAGASLDLMDAIARAIPVGVLAEAVGVPDVPVAAVVAVARAYHPVPGEPDAPVDPAADRAVARLVAACGGVADEATAARIGLWVQACDATAGLIAASVPVLLAGGGTGRLAADGTGRPVEEVLAEVLRRTPPVRATRRTALRGARLGAAAVPEGELVVLDLAAGDLPWGAGAHACPGREHAVAIAAGVLDGFRHDDVRHWRLVDGPDGSGVRVVSV